MLAESADWELDHLCLTLATQGLNKSITQASWAAGLVSRPYSQQPAVCPSDLGWDIPAAYMLMQQQRLAQVQINQLINQSINQPTDRPTNQPTNQPTKQPINQSITAGGLADLDSSSDGGDDVFGWSCLACILAELLHRLHLVQLLECSFAQLVLHHTSCISMCIAGHSSTQAWARMLDAEESWFDDSTVTKQSELLHQKAIQTHLLSAVTTVQQHLKPVVMLWAAWAKHYSTACTSVQRLLEYSMHDSTACTTTQLAL